MKAMRFKSCFLTAAMILAGIVSNAAAADYPSRPITIVVPYEPGGGDDTFTRAIALQAQDILGVKVFVENTTGRGGPLVSARSHGPNPTNIRWALYRAAPS